MPNKQYPANFLFSSIFYFLLFLIPFSVIRLYFYFNYYYSANEFVSSDFFWLVATGIRFDLCVIGFLLIPCYGLYLVSYFEKINALCVVFNQIYKSIVTLLVVLVIHLNLPFMSVNSAFGLPYWMRFEDYQSVIGIGCEYCYGDYRYLDSIYPIQLISSFIFILILLSSFSKWNFFSKKFNGLREVIFILAIAFMCRGRVGQHHLRYEDSVWHKSVLLNELSNNPLWLIDKHKN